MKRVNLLVACSIPLLLASCDSGDGGIVGQWEPVDPAASEMTLSFAADSTFKMDTGQFIGEGRFSLEGGTLVLEPTGSLGIVVPAGFTGELFGNTLNLCNPGDLCTDFQKVR